MTSSRPYLLRALLEWISDNGMTAHLLVLTEVPGVVVPNDFIQDGKITLNIGPHAVQGLEMGNDFVRFSARFAGRPMRVEVPVTAVLAIYSRETGQGMLFGSEPGTLLDAPGEDAESEAQLDAPERGQRDGGVTGPASSDAGRGGPDGGGNKPRRKGPALKLVK